MVTREEALALQDGTLVRVVWSGGNGPHDYVIDVDRFGTRRIAQHGRSGPRVIIGGIEEARSIDVLHFPAPNPHIAAGSMLALTPAELTEALAAIRSERCLYCGGYDPRCPCENDE